MLELHWEIICGIKHEEASRKGKATFSSKLADRVKESTSSSRN